jgi:hypothetical protein
MHVYMLIALFLIKVCSTLQTTAIKKLQTNKTFYLKPSVTSKKNFIEKRSHYFLILILKQGKA